MATTRKRKAKVAPLEDQPFTVGVPELSPPEAEPEERPTISEETVAGLLSLRDHLSLRAPSLLWPLHTLPSLGQHMSDLESASAAVDSAAIRHAMSNEKLSELRRFLLEDGYAFTYSICGHRDLDPNVHMAMCYAACGQAGKLAWLMTQSGFDGYLIDQFRAECSSRSIDPATISGVYALDGALDWVNMRLPRGVYKSSAITHGGATLTATLDPNTTAQITHAKEEKALEICGQIGRTVQSGIYRDIFPDRAPENSRSVKSDAVTLGGRNISHPQTTMQAQGYLSKDIGGHFDRFWVGDLVVRGPRGNATATALPGVAKWLSGMQGYAMLSHRVRRVHEGTVAIDGDDYTWLTHKERRKRVFSVLVPIELHPNGPPKSILDRGIPTMPTFLPAERITEIQLNVLADDADEIGIENWLCDYLLVPAAQGGVLFPEDVISDPDRSWMGPYEHPRLRLKGGEKFKSQFLVARVDRDKDDCPIGTDKRPLDTRTDEWRKSALLASWNPWEDMDRVLTVNLSWSAGAKTWAITAAAADPNLVRFQLETRTGEDVGEPFAFALSEMERIYKPRAIGIEAKAWSDHVFRNRFKTDARLRIMERRVVGVEMTQTTEEARIRSGLAVPLLSHQWLLLPSQESLGDFGAAATRKELTKFRPGADTPWPITESLAAVSAIVRRISTPEQRSDAKRLNAQRDAAYKQSLGVFGVPNAA